jgi:hypothetical protein
MIKSAHQAAIDQAQLLAAYLHATPPNALDMHFIRRHLDALQEFAQAAITENPSKWDVALRLSPPQDLPPSAN